MGRFRLDLKSVAIIVTCLAVYMIFTGCDKTETRLSDKQIITFNFDAPPTVGVINEAEKTITVYLPLGTDISALTPVINVSSKATVNPASGVTQNFTEPVIYTVTAEDGSTAQYTITVNIEEEEKVFIDAVVRLDFCNEYLIIIKQGNPVSDWSYKPDNLPDLFKVDNLKINVIFHRTGEGYRCGFGFSEIINIIEIK